MLGVSAGRRGEGDRAVAARGPIVNGVPRPLGVFASESLLVFLRAGLGLTGAKLGCGEGVCGVCTVLVDWAPVRACVTPAAAVEGRRVTTIEGLAGGGLLHPLQRAFLDANAVQCGYCTPGMILAAAALLERTPEPSGAEIATSLDGNLCRCCAHPSIVRAVQAAAGLGDTRSTPRLAAASTRTADLARPPRPWSSLPSSQRDLFSILGDGLVITARRGPSSRGWSTCEEVWLHLAADGSVTGFTGKVDVGQRNSRAFAALVAEGLGVPTDAVALVLGDTDLCPYDLGTFGSRSVPDAAPLFAAAASEAGRILRELASARFGPAAVAGLEADSLSAERRRVRYGELLSGVRRSETVTAEGTLSGAAQWRVAGRPFASRGADAYVTGAALFPSDLTCPGMLAGAVLKPPAVGAHLRALAPAQTTERDGARLVRSGSRIGVVADGERAARAALGRLGASWIREPQPPEAELEAHLRSHPAEPVGFDQSFAESHGDVDNALVHAPIRLERTYTTAYIAHAPLETRVALAQWSGDRLTVWTGTQRPFAIRERLAGEFGIDEEAVRVVAPTAGGGFGGKHTGDAAVEAAWLARRSGRPVMVRWSHGEEFQHAYARPAAVIDVRSGSALDGTLQAWDVLTTNAGSAGIASPYRTAASRIRYQPAESPLPQGSYRALAATANHFARETHLDEVAAEAGVDPLELRLRQLEDNRLAAVLTTVAERAGWTHGSLGAGHGVGIACGVEKDARVATYAEIRVGADGRVAVRRLVTALDCGAIIDPGNLRSQVEGATIMGLGGALFEALHFDGGAVLNPTLAAYRVPRFTDVPALEVLLIDRRDIPSAGAGETPIVAVAPALANALHSATGCWRRSLPLEP